MTATLAPTSAPPAAPPLQAEPTGVPRRGSKWRANLTGYLFISPFLLYFAVFLLAPMVIALVLSFTEWNMRTDPVWVGFDNYRNLLTNQVLYPDFWPSLGVTLSYVAMSVPLAIIFALIVAAVLNSNVKGEGFFKTAYYIPNVTAIVAVAAMWIFMLDPQFGLFNKALGTNVSFLGNPSTALSTLAVMAIWGAVGYNVLILLAAMKSIDESLYEAASIDGANAFQRFRAVTLPGIQPVMFFLLITAIIGAFQAFDQMYLMTSGGPDGATMTYLLSLYNHAFRYFEMGAASAMSYILLLVILLITWIGFKLVPQQRD